MSPFGELLAKLAHAEVRYVLVGGGAVLLHGHARTTGDLDILIEASEENARCLLRALQTWSEDAVAELTVEELAYPQVGCIRIIEEFALDVFTLMLAKQSNKSLVYADLLIDAHQRRLSTGTVVTYASIAKLLELKAGTGRSKDASDIAILSEIARGTRQKTPVDLTIVQPEPTASSDEFDDEN